MTSKNINKVMLIGNIIKKPELHKTDKGISVCTFHLLTDREWRSKGQESKETTKHICVAWDKMADICNQLLYKGCLVYVDGRLSTHSYLDINGNECNEVQIVVEEMLLLREPKVKDDPALDYLGPSQAYLDSI